MCHERHKYSWRTFQNFVPTTDALCRNPLFFDAKRLVNIVAIVFADYLSSSSPIKYMRVSAVGGDFAFYLTICTWSNHPRIIVNASLAGGLKG